MDAVMMQMQTEVYQIYVFLSVWLQIVSSIIFIFLRWIDWRLMEKKIRIHKIETNNRTEI